jgi:hypothetical protein
VDECKQTVPCYTLRIRATEDYAIPAALFVVSASQRRDLEIRMFYCSSLEIKDIRFKLQFHGSLLNLRALKATECLLSKTHLSENSLKISFILFQLASFTSYG